jgi:hypothetical protein
MTPHSQEPPGQQAIPVLRTIPFFPAERAPSGAAARHHRFTLLAVPAVLTASSLAF